MCEGLEQASWSAVRAPTMADWGLVWSWITILVGLFSRGLKHSDRIAYGANGNVTSISYASHCCTLCRLSVCLYICLSVRLLVCLPLYLSRSVSLYICLCFCCIICVSVFVCPLAVSDLVFVPCILTHSHSWYLTPLLMSLLAGCSQQKTPQNLHVMFRWILYVH